MNALTIHRVLQHYLRNAQAQNNSFARSRRPLQIRMFDHNSFPMDQVILNNTKRLQVEDFCIVASSALLFFDFVITLSQEVHRIWGRRFSVATVVYLLTRYGAVFERVILLVSLFLVTPYSERCALLLRLDDVLTDVNYASIGAFTAMRLWAILGGRGIPAFSVAVLWVARIAIAIYLQASYTPLAFGLPLYGCGAVWTGDIDRVYHLAVIANSLMLASDFILVALTWFKTGRIYLQSRNTGISGSLYVLLLRDGTIYFVLMLVIQTFAIVSSQIGTSFIIFNAWPYFSQALIVIFLTRFMLNLRGIVLPEDSVTHTVTLLSRVHFVSVTGNLGADLETFAGVNLDEQSVVRNPGFLEDGVKSGDEQNGTGQNNETFNLQLKVGRYAEDMSY